MGWSSDTGLLGGGCGVSSLVRTLRMKETVGELVGGVAGTGGALKCFSLDEISLRLKTVIDWGMLMVAGLACLAATGCTTGRSESTLGLLKFGLSIP